MAAPLVVRDRRADAMPGLALGGPLSAWTDRVHARARSARPAGGLVAQGRSAPPARPPPPAAPVVAAAGAAAEHRRVRRPPRGRPAGPARLGPARPAPVGAGPAVAGRAPPRRGARPPPT